MSRKLCLIGALGIFPCFPVIAQTNAQTNLVVGAGYKVPAPIYAAPGQVITLFVPGVAKSLNQTVRAPDGVWPTLLAGITVMLIQNTKIPVPIFEVRPMSTCGPPFPLEIPCGALTAITVQIPYELIPLCPMCLQPFGPRQLLVSENGQDGFYTAIMPLADQVHVLTSCDILLQSGLSFIFPLVNYSGLPCAPMVIHGDGQLVSAMSPAKQGEELAAYALGIGVTNPAARAGQPAPAPLHAVQAMALDYNFHANALPAKPAEGSPVALFTGLTPKYPGLYQINFVVPQAPAGTKPCAGLIPFGPTSPRPTRWDGTC
jgi:hypothetical protein